MLQFQHSTMIEVDKRNRRYFQAQWLTLTMTVMELYTKYIKENPEHAVSWGMFLALRPFYMRSATTKDIEVCCCKLHLHARWAVRSLITCCKKQEIDLGQVTTYETFFERITEFCPTSTSTYIPWECTPDKKTVCEEIGKKWNNLRSYVEEIADSTVTVTMSKFVKTTYQKKNGEEGTRLELVHNSVDMSAICDFIAELLPSIINHRNELKHYRQTIHDFRQLTNCIAIDVDFSEKLKVPTKMQAQSQHWNQKGITVHSGVHKQEGIKAYHAYLSEDPYQDQAFVDAVIRKMLDECNLCEGCTLMLESDNCSSQ